MVKAKNFCVPTVVQHVCYQLINNIALCKLVLEKRSWTTSAQILRLPMVHILPDEWTICKAHPANPAWVLLSELLPCTESSKSWIRRLRKVREPKTKLHHLKAIYFFTLRKNIKDSITSLDEKIFYVCNNTFIIQFSKYFNTSFFLLNLFSN